jgi:hypothetical protein
MKGEPLPANISLFDIMVKVKFIVFNATFYNISVISRRSVLLVEEIESLEKIHHQPVSGHGHLFYGN